MATPPKAPADPQGEAKTNGSGEQQQAGGQAEAQAQAPSMKILGQYLKDFSFESPNAPQSLLSQQGQPEINIQVNVNAKPINGPDYEVELHIEANASAQSKVLYAVDLLYAGIFRLENIPQDMLHPVVLIECPRMLFPFARQILSDATRNGSFQPLLLDPIDFGGMYQRRAAEGKGATA